VSRGLVLVTGASTGIGEACAGHLASLGFSVFAGVRKDADADRLRGEGVEPVRLDVTDGDSIEAAARRVGGDLAGLVNNAGIAVSGPVEFVPLDEWRRQLEVNVLGQVAVTQAFLPALRRARGRVVNNSSIGGRIALPLAGPYAASKFALEAVSDSLRREVRGFGVEVVVVEPGGVATPIWDKGLDTADSLMDGMPEDAERLYGGLAAALRAEAERLGREGLPPTEVAQVVGRALTARKPRTRYLVGRDAKARAKLAAILPDRAFDSLVARALKAPARDT
jgi:NAD(P)-dependent dehydrogenase (short-subunit alcohol dehydrogenase family)